MLDVYKLVIQMFPSYTSSSASNVKQEILLGLGDLYTQAHMMFNVDMYLQLLGILHLAIRSSRNSSNVEREAIQENLPPVLRTILEILPLLHPALLQSTWPLFIKELVYYVIGWENDTSVNEMKLTLLLNHDQKGGVVVSHNASNSGNKFGNLSNKKKEIMQKIRYDVSNGGSSDCVKLAVSRCLW
ncbi:uncharacterized protein LOC121997482 isoform X1 [Zingiber officinale]|uniref:uncharacterized protein LOC121997482 isoform X1 n=1 Tax=Zingiber officinale TaxID=94328 RepID=UPI001C4CF99C|nr:uncharacterized protein LOC121997482 isoform X1 [Zingiber officinale]